MRIGSVGLAPGKYPGLFPQEFKIDISTDGDTWTPMIYAEDFQAQGESVWRFEPSRARFVRISGRDVRSADGRYYWQLGEITIYRGLFYRPPASVSEEEELE